MKETIAYLKSLLKDDRINVSSPWTKFFSKQLIENDYFLEGVTIAEDKEFGKELSNNE